MSKTQDYFIKRAEHRMKTAHKMTDKTVAKINRAYDKAMEEINLEVSRMVKRLMVEGEYTRLEAVGLINKKLTDA